MSELVKAMEDKFGVSAAAPVAVAAAGGGGGGEAAEEKTEFDVVLVELGNCIRAARFAVQGGDIGQFPRGDDDATGVFTRIPG